MQTVLNSLGVTKPGMYAAFAGGIAQVVTCIVLIHPAFSIGMGYIGEATGISVGGYVQLAAICAYVRCVL